MYQWDITEFLNLIQYDPEAHQREKTDLDLGTNDKDPQHCLL